MSEDITAAQLRAARAFVGWTREELAAASGTTARTLARLEAGQTVARASTAHAIKEAFLAAGVTFVVFSDGGFGIKYLDQ